jgi:APA family basic amino acid/polyamine antiporter
MWSGVGLVIANMVGVGVLLSAGFMAQELGPGGILLSWIVGATIALSGALAYGQLAILSGRSGGEYRYLHDYMHPYLGYLAGWASLLIGFSAPIAIAAFAAGAFLNKLGWPLTPQATGTLVIAAMTLAHGIHLSWSRSLQNVLVAVKFTFVLSFIAVGLLLGSKVWPAWTAPLAGPGPPVRAFLENQYWVAFAFSGWNAAVYAAGEFRRPRRDVARALTLGCLIVGCAYLLINWVFVANLTPDQAIAVADHEATQITLAHLVMTNIAGESGAAIVSSVIVVVLLQTAQRRPVGSRRGSAVSAPHTDCARCRHECLCRSHGILNADRPHAVQPGSQGSPSEGTVHIRGRHICVGRDRDSIRRYNVDQGHRPGFGRNSDGRDCRIRDGLTSG